MMIGIEELEEEDIQEMTLAISRLRHRSLMETSI